MGAGKQEAMVVEMPNSSSQNPIAQLQNKFKELEIVFKGWLSKQSIPVEAAVVTATSGLQGAAIGGFMGTLTQDVSSAMPTPPPGANLNPQAMASFQQAQALAGGPLVQARNFAVMTGANAGISCVLKRIRGKEDVQSSMAAAFGSGALFSLVSGMGGPNPVPNALTSGIFFALVQGGLFEVEQYEKFTVGRCTKIETVSEDILQLKVQVNLNQLGRKFSQPPAEDTHYVRTKTLLSSLGLQNYEKNFKKGLLTDATLPLLTDSALRDVRIPPGPRLLILDRIQRDPELRKK